MCGTATQLMLYSVQTKLYSTVDKRVVGAQKRIGKAERRSVVDAERGSFNWNYGKRLEGAGVGL